MDHYRPARLHYAWVILAVTCLTVVLTAGVHSVVGLFMHWSGAQQGEGCESHLLVLAMAAFLMIRRAGGLSVDRALTGVVLSHKAQARLALS